MRIAAYAKSGAETRSPTAARTTSTTRFMTNDDRERRAGGTHTSGMPSSRCMLARGPMRPKSRGTTSTMTSRSRSDRTTSIVWLSGSFENATMTRSTGARRRAPGDPRARRACRRRASRPGSRAARRRRTRRDRAVFRVLADLPGDELADLAGARRRPCAWRTPLTGGSTSAQLRGRSSPRRLRAARRRRGGRAAATPARSSTTEPGRTTFRGSR